MKPINVTKQQSTFSFMKAQNKQHKPKEAKSKQKFTREETDKILGRTNNEVDEA